MPWLTLTASLAAVGIGVISTLAFPIGAPEAGKKERSAAGLAAENRPDAGDGRRRFRRRLLGAAGTPLAETEEKAKIIEEVLSENPDVDAYVRRTGAELGLFATATNRGDIQVVFRPAEDDPVSCFASRVRPEFEKIEKEMIEGKREAKKFGAHFTGAATAEGKAYIRGKYRRRSGEEVVKEIKGGSRRNLPSINSRSRRFPIITDELNDLSGANKPVEVKLFGPDYHELDELAEKVGKVFKKLKDTNKASTTSTRRLRRQSRFGREDRRRATRPASV